jgi:class 3 adenylate cyclase
MQSLQEYAGASHNKGTLALVFTDIVGSTDLNNHFGDDEWLSILRQHFDRARQLIDAHHGYLIKFIGDSCIVAFRSTVDAFQFSINFFVDTGHEYTSIRAGFHFGSVLIVDDDVYGSMVNLTSRIQHSAERWGIAISDPAFKDVKGVLGRSAPLMEEKRTRPPLKGFRPQPVWQISTQEMHDAERGRRRARRRAGVPQPQPQTLAAPVQPPATQTTGHIAPQPYEDRLKRIYDVLPRYNPPKDDDKK